MTKKELVEELASIIGGSSAYSAPVSHYLDEDAMAEEIVEHLEYLGCVLFSKKDEE